MIPVILIAVLSIAVAVLFYIFIRPSFSLWFHSMVSGARVQLLDIAKMHLEKVKQADIDQIILEVIRASKAGVHVDTKDLDDHRQGGGSIPKVVSAMIVAHNANFELPFKLAASIDRSGLDVVEAIKEKVKPIVLNTDEVAAITRDGIELKIFCRVTMRAKLENYVGGATRETILARVGEGIVAAVGSAEYHQDIIANPFLISDHIMTMDRDEDDDLDIHQNTAYEVLSIDVADVNVGINQAARLSIDKAKADAKMARADAETRRSRAVAHHEHLRIKIIEYRGKLVQAEAQIPLAIAEALGDGKTFRGPEPKHNHGHGHGEGHGDDHGHGQENGHGDDHGHGWEDGHESDHDHEQKNVHGDGQGHEQEEAQGHANGSEGGNPEEHADDDLKHPVETAGDDSENTESKEKDEAHAAKH